MKTTYQKCKAVFVLGVVLAASFIGCKTEAPPASGDRAPVPAAVSPTPTAIEAKPASVPAPTFPKEMTLFDGQTLKGWQVTDFAGHGQVEVEDGELRIYMGADLSGVNWTNGPLPKSNYEIEFDAKKLDGSDFFCGLTVPVRESHCSLILGGWGGGIVGISSLDGMDASENDTSKSLYFERNRWYHIRMRVLEEKILVWVDDQKVVDVEIKGRKVAMRPGDIERGIPLGIATWQTSSALKNIKLRLVMGE